MYVCMYKGWAFTALAPRPTVVLQCPLGYTGVGMSIQCKACQLGYGLEDRAFELKSW
jgi:hypothetical protein